MVRRSARSADDGRNKNASALTDRKSRGFVGGGGRRRRPRGAEDAEDGFHVQRAGELNLHNPLIPAELDEDIDDDLAFNSDDEEKYGHFFRQPSKPVSGAGKRKSSSTTTKKSKSATGKTTQTRETDEDDEEALVRAQLRALGEIDDDDDLDFHDGKGNGHSDEEYMDLADMLGGAEEEEEGANGHPRRKSKPVKDKNTKTAKKKKSQTVDEDGVAKKRRRARVTEEAESLFGPAAALEGSSGATYNSTMRELVASKEASGAAEAVARLEEGMKNKRNLISTDVDDYTKAVTLRSEVRAVVSKDLDRYKTFLRERRDAKHVQFPLPMPESNPVPVSLGAIASAAEARFADEALKRNDDNSTRNDNNTNLNNEGKINSSGNSFKASAMRLAGTVNDILTRVGLSKSQLQAEKETGGIVPFVGDENNEEDNENGNYTSHGPSDGAPTKGYVAKLKAMLSYENSRRRRLNRIKSKTYRRILRKEKEREKERRDKAFELLNPEKARARLAEKLVKARIEERVTQKHKNTSKWVRHAKRFAEFDDNTKDAINEQHMAHQRLMQKMDEGADEDDYLNHADQGSEAASSEEERVVDHLIREATGQQGSDSRAENQQDGIGGNQSKKSLTSVLWRSIDDDEEEEEDGEDGNGEGHEKRGKGSKRKGGSVAKSNMTPIEKARAELHSMKFMQHAKEREEKRYAEVLEQLQEDIRRDMRGEALHSDDEPSDLDEGSDASMQEYDSEEAAVKRAQKAKRAKKQKQQQEQQMKKSSSAAGVGRMDFKKRTPGVGGKEKEVVENIQLKRHSGIKADAPEPTEDDADNNNNSNKNKNHMGKGNRNTEEESETDNVPITDGSHSSDSRRSSRNSARDRNTTPTKAKAPRQPTQRRPKDEFAGSRLPSGGVAASPSSSSSPRAVVPSAQSTRVTILPTADKRPRADPIPDPNDHAHETAPRKRLKTEETTEVTSPTHPEEGEALQMHQEYLVARAFAHDEVDAEFLAEKSAQVDAIMKPVDKNATLPGWGEWGGEDARLNRRHQSRVEEMTLRRQIERSTLLRSRADAALDHVIINHDGVELVPDRMTLHMVPRPFSNPTEFARSMRHPTGPEWNSAIGFKDANQPRVEVRQGQTVMPLDLSLRGRKKTAKTTRRKTTGKGTHTQA